MLATKLIKSSARGVAASQTVAPSLSPGVSHHQARTICHKSKLKTNKVYRWPYETTSWSVFNFYMDPFTKKKFNDNSKIIQVEGNISSGKTEFARQLADELGMHFLPPVDLDNLYINEHGYDYRALNTVLPERLRICDLEMFHENPARHSVIHMQYYLFKMRCYQHVEAMRHIFNTGQGVVITRSPYTERAIVEAMQEMGWLPLGYLRGDGVRFYDWKMRYIYLRNLTLAELMPPHLTIYLDTPVDICLERIKNDPDPQVANSTALSRNFLESVERAFKDVVLPKQEYNMHVLTVDHPAPKNYEELMDVVDDIEELDFGYDHHDSRFERWNNDSMFWHFDQRLRLTSDLHTKYFQYLQQPYYDIAGLGDSITNADLHLRQSLYESHVGAVGFDTNLSNDSRFKSWLQAYYGYRNFGERVSKTLRVDFA